MVNDIDAPFFLDAINLSKIGKYGKFINFVPLPEEYRDRVFFPKDTPFHFYTDNLIQEKLTKDEMFNAMLNVQVNLDKAIQQDLLRNNDLQSKILMINRKANERIEKLTEKATKKMKLKEKYNYKTVQEYFEPKPTTEEASSIPSSTEEQSPSTDPSSCPSDS